MKKPGRVYTGNDVSQLPMPTEKQIEELVHKMRKHMRNKGPLLQGAVLADLVSMYIAGHAPAVRAAAIDIWIDTMRKMIPDQEKRITDHYGGKPEGWDPN